MGFSSELEALCDAAVSFHARGYAFGSTGNLRVRAGDHVFITPTGQSLRHTTVEALAEIDLTGEALNGSKASKEFPFHLAAYVAQPAARAIVHLHSTWSVLLSCLDTLDEANPLPVFTPYYLMRVAPLAVVPYCRPGSENLATVIGEAAARSNCLLLRNHGLVALGRNMSEAVDRAEELEETCRLYFASRNETLRLLTAEQRDEIERVFGNK